MQMFPRFWIGLSSSIVKLRSSKFVTHQNTIVKMSEESKKGIYDQSSFDAIKPRLNGTKPKYSAMFLEN